MALLRYAVLALALALGGCVFEDNCVNGAVRSDDGRCTLDGVDAGARDGAVGMDAGDDPDGGDNDGGDNDGGDNDGGGDPDAGPPRRIVDFTLGPAHACAVDDRGGLFCWGANALGALATGDISPRNMPVRIDLGAPVTDVSGRAIHVCATTATPSFFCWGDNGNGQIGDGTTSMTPVTTPFEVTGLGSVRTIEASFANTCFNSLAGGVVCWGRNDTGQLGIGSANPMPQTAPGSPVTAAGMMTLENAQQVAAADRHTCFRADDSLFCVGAGNNGELGTGDTSDTTEAVEVRISGATAITDVAVSYSHSCAIADGSVYCWGDNSRGIAPGAAATLLTPSPVTLPRNATQLATGEAHVCALLDDGTVTCWGSTEYGSLGDGTVSMGMSVPVVVSGLSNVQRIEAGYGRATCALTMDGELWCWGQDSIEELGGPPPAGSTTLFLTSDTTHPTPIRVEPFGD